MLIKFKNLKKSDLTRLAVKEKVEPLIRKFPDLEEGGCGFAALNVLD
jgi:hypothetical protein